MAVRNLRRRRYVRCAASSSVFVGVCVVTLALALGFARVSGGLSGAEPSCDELEQRVKALIHELGSVHEINAPREEMGRRQDELFAELERLGVRAVPAMTRHMDNRAPVVRGAITLENRAPDRFEAVRFYRIEKIVDGIAAMLNQLNPGYRYGEPVPYATEATRDAAVAGWRRYASGEFRRLHPGMCP